VLGGGVIVVLGAGIGLVGDSLGGETATPRGS
jgi:hypothetical protein